MKLDRLRTDRTIDNPKQDREYIKSKVLGYLVPRCSATQWEQLISLTTTPSGSVDRFRPLDLTDLSPCLGPVLCAVFWPLILIPILSPDLVPFLLGVYVWAAGAAGAAGAVDM